MDNFNRLQWRAPDSKPSFFMKIKQSLLMKNTPVEAGKFALLSALPLLIVYSLCYCFVFLVIFVGVFGFDTVPEWMLVVSLLPLLTGPLLGVMGIIHSIVKIKEKRAWLGLLLSVLSLIENALLIFGMFYIGSRY